MFYQAAEPKLWHSDGRAMRDPPGDLVGAAAGLVSGDI